MINNLNTIYNWVFVKILDPFLLEVIMNFWSIYQDIVDTIFKVNNDSKLQIIKI